MSDDFYRAIAKEIETQTLEPALWMRAFAECDGNDAQAKALYIRLRHAQMSARESEQKVSAQDGHGSLVQASSAAVPSQISELDRIRSGLSKHLLQMKKSSLYATLGLSPNDSDQVISAAILRLQTHLAAGETLSSEAKYAIEMIGDVSIREAYDRKLFALLTKEAKALTEPMIDIDADQHAAASWFRGNIARGLGIGVVMLIVAYSFGFFKSKSERDAAALSGATKRQTLEAVSDTSAARSRTDGEIAYRSYDSQGRQADSWPSTGRAEQPVARSSDTQSSYFAAQIESNQARLEEQRIRLEEQKRREETQRKSQAAFEEERQRKQQEYEGLRASAEAKRQNCTSARQRNNYGEVQRWCN